jgi:hypothetical protein
MADELDNIDACEHIIQINAALEIQKKTFSKKCDDIITPVCKLVHGKRVLLLGKTIDDVSGMMHKLRELLEITQENTWEKEHLHCTIMDLEQFEKSSCNSPNV